MTNIELNAHFAIIIEGSMLQNVVSKGPIRLQMIRDLISNDIQFVKCMANILSVKSAGKEYPMVEEFKREAGLYLQKKIKQLQLMAQSVNGRYDLSLGDMANPLSHGSHFFQPSQQSQGNYSMHNGNMSTMPPSAGNANASSSRKSSNAIPFTSDPDLPDDHKATTRIDYEKSEPIVRLLAQVRKVGMDILFPQSTHDKVTIHRLKHGAACVLNPVLVNVDLGVHIHGDKGVQYSSPP